MNRVEMISRVAGALEGSPFGATYFDDAERVLDAILPQVTTVEELEALSGRSLLYGTASGQAEPVLWQPSWQDPQEVLEMFGPLTVVWTP